MVMLIIAVYLNCIALGVTNAARGASCIVQSVRTILRCDHFRKCNVNAVNCNSVLRVTCPCCFVCVFLFFYFFTSI